LQNAGCDVLGLLDPQIEGYVLPQKTNIEPEKIKPLGRGETYLQTTNFWGSMFSFPWV